MEFVILVPILQSSVDGLFLSILTWLLSHILISRPPQVSPCALFSPGIRSCPVRGLAIRLWTLDLCFGGLEGSMV